MSIAIRINPKRVRLYRGESSLKAFFDLDLGVSDGEGTFIGLATVPDWSLLQRTDGQWWAKEPETPRIRNGQIVLEEGTKYPQKDARFKKFFPEGGTKPSKDSYRLWDAITEKAVEAYQQVAGGAQAPVTDSRIAEPEPGTPLTNVGVEDDDFPF